MGLSSKLQQVSGDQGLQTFRQAAETIRRQQSEALKCPRCSSTNTKFCYYNNYNKSQPRHFCKSCKRHWTKGGTLRNVPVGGARKNKRPKPSAAHHQDHSSSFPLSGGEHKNMSNILYHAFIARSSSKGVDNVSILGKPALVGNSNAIAPQTQIIPNTGFQFSSLDMNASLNQPFDHLARNIEESTITTLNILGGGGSSSSGSAWESSGTLDLPNYWNWNDIDVLTSISWDDQDNAAIKP